MDILIEDPRFCVAAHDRLIVIIWGRDPQRQDLEGLTLKQREHVAAHGHCVTLTVIRAKLSVRVSDGTREASADNFREFSGLNKGAAVVVEGGGLWASLIRSVMTGIQMLSFAVLPQKMFDSIEEAAHWVACRPGLEPPLSAEVDAIIAEIHELADRYGEG